MKQYVLFLTLVDLCVSSTREEAIDRITKGVILYNTWNLTATSGELCNSDSDLVSYLSNISHQRTLRCSSLGAPDNILDHLSRLRSDSMMGSETLQILLRRYQNVSVYWDCGQPPPLLGESSILNIATNLITEGLIWLMNRDLCTAAIDIYMTDVTVLHERMHALISLTSTRPSDTCIASAIMSADVFLSDQLAWPHIQTPMIPDICFPVEYTSSAKTFVSEIKQDSRGLISIPSFNDRISVPSNILIDLSPVCPILRGNAADCSTKDLWSCDAVEGCYVDWENSICADTPPGFYSTSMSSIIPCDPIASDQFFVGVGWTNPNCPSKCSDPSTYLVNETCENIPSFGYTAGSCDSDNSLHSCLLDQSNDPYVEFPDLGACDPAYWKYLITLPVAAGDLDFSVWIRLDSLPLNPVRIIGLIGAWELRIQNDYDFLLVTDSNVTRRVPYLNSTDWFHLRIAHHRITLDGTHDLFDLSDFMKGFLNTRELFLGPAQPVKMLIFQPRWVSSNSLIAYNYVEPPDGWAKGTDCFLRSALSQTCQGQPLLLNEYTTTTSTTPDPTTTFLPLVTFQDTTSTTDYSTSIPETISSSEMTNIMTTFTQTETTLTESTSTSEPLTTLNGQPTTSTMTDTVLADPPSQENPETSTFEPITTSLVEYPITSTDTVPSDYTSEGTWGTTTLDPKGDATTTGEPQARKFSSTTSTPGIASETSSTLTTGLLPITSDGPFGELTTSAQPEDLQTTSENTNTSTKTEENSQTILELTTGATYPEAPTTKTQATSATAEPNQQFPETTSSSTTSEAEADSTSYPDVHDKHASSTTHIPDPMRTTTTVSSYDSSKFQSSVVGTAPQIVDTTSSAVSGDLLIHPSNKVDSYAQRDLDFKAWITGGIVMGLLVVLMLAICSCVTIVQRRRMTRPITQIQ